MSTSNDLIVAINNHISTILDNGFAPSAVILDEQKLAQMLRECSYNFTIFDKAEIYNLESIYNALANKYNIGGSFTNNTIKIMNIPSAQVANYNKILKLFAGYGIDIIKDCGAVCNSKNKNAITMFNMFVAGVTATEIGNTAAATLIFKQVEQSLKFIP